MKKAELLNKLKGLNNNVLNSTLIALNSYNNFLDYLTLLEFNEENFKLVFTDQWDAARAVFFGKVNNWADQYFRVNVYGNVETVSEIDYHYFYDWEDVVNELLELEKKGELKHILDNLPQEVLQVMEMEV